MYNLISFLKQHNAYRYLVYHVISISFMLITAGIPDISGGGPCNAGIDLVLYLPVILIGLILFLVSTAYLLAKGRTYLPMFLINFTALCFLIALVFIRI